MKLFRRAAGFLLAGLLWVNDVTWAQEVRRAQPFQRTRFRGPCRSMKRPRCLTTDPRRQSNRLINGNWITPRALSRQDVRLAIPEYEKYLSDYGGAPAAPMLFWIRRKLSLLGKKRFRS